MAKQYIQEKIYGNPGEIITINRSNILSKSIYKPTSKVIKVTGPANATIYASYVSNSTDIPYPDIKGVLVYDHVFSYSSNNNVSIEDFDLDVWMTTDYSSAYTTTFTYVSSHSGNKWKVNNTSTYVNITDLGISYSVASGSSPQNGTVVTVTTDYARARYEIWVPSIGNWNVVCVGSAGYSENAVEITVSDDTYWLDISTFQAFVSVNYTKGATCSITNIENNITLTATDTSGYYTFNVPYTGIWRINVELEFGTSPNNYIKTKDDSVFVSTLNQQITKTVELISNNLEECTWEEIKYVADQHMGDKYWQIGDCKSIILNGPWTYVRYFNNERFYAFIIGFDHNAEIEGSGITFELGRLEPNGNDICFFEGMGKGAGMPSYYDYDYSGRTYDETYFDHIWMNSGTSAIGWQNSSMRTYYLGAVSKTPYDNTTNPSGYNQGSIMSLLPDDLRDVMKKVKKWTDNSGGEPLSANNVTQTEDYLFLLSGYEVFGTTTGFGSYNCNAAEANKQDRYEYYTNLSHLKYYNDCTNQSPYGIQYNKYYIWLRSPVNELSEGSTGQEWAVATSHQQTELSKASGRGRKQYIGTASTGFCPCFVVGSEDPA